MKLVLLGAGSEYSLAPLASEARRRGLTVIELDMYATNWRHNLKDLIPREFILVTSCHPYMDPHFHLEDLGLEADIEALPTFIETYAPLRTYFIPHDLTEPFKDNELSSLPFFDALLMPNEKSWYLREYARIEVVGWIGCAIENEFSQCEIVFLPSEIPRYRMLGPEAFGEAFKSVLEYKPRIKFPVFPGLEELSRYAADCGCEVVSSSVGSTGLIRCARIVVSNGLSSIVAEAAGLGRTTLCVADGVHPISSQERRFKGMPTVTILPSEDIAEWINFHLETVSLPPPKNVLDFDFDAAFKVILEG